MSCTKFRQTKSRTYRRSRSKLAHTMRLKCSIIANHFIFNIWTADMTATKFPIHTVPHSRLPFRPSRTALVLLLATGTLAVLLVFSTYENINRAQMLMESFLLEKGETIIRSLEAGSRTSIMHHMGNGNPLHTLLSENIREDDIIFISINELNGTIIDQVGYPSPPSISTADISNMLAADQSVIHMETDTGVFIVSKLFNSRYHAIGGHMQGGQAGTATFTPDDNKHIISIGLLTKDFEAARKQDVTHTMFMGGILFLVGSSGLYFLFLYQNMRVAKSTLADMKLYTDSVIDSIPVGLVTLDAGNRVVSCNKNTEELLGAPLSQLHGRNINDALPANSACLSDICDDTFDHPTECTDASGRTIPVRISCSSLVNRESKAIGKVLIIRDMSTIRDMELQLERSRRMAALGKMAAGIAHEIRNPLGTLRGFAQFFGNHAHADEEKQYASLMISEVDRLNQTVSGLLQFARPREPQLQHFSIDELFAKISALMKPDFLSGKLQFNFPANTFIQLHADPDLLLQVLMNLLKNSINATDPEGNINLSATEDSHNIRIAVTDTGHGMPEKDREKMFDPFFTTGKTGTGLGLAVSHQIIEQHHGTFDVITAPDKGTTITIILPKDKQGS